LSEKHFEEYGIYHRVARRHRVTGVFKEDLSPADYLPKGSEVPEAEESKPKVGAKTRVSEQAEASEEDIAYYTDQLQQRLNAFLLTQNPRPRFDYSVFKQEVAIHSCNGKSYKVNVPKMGSEMTLDLFKKIKLIDSLNIARAIAEKEGDLDNALLAFFYTATGDRVNASYHFRKAGAFKDRVEAAFAEK
jgi:hypothetical protein